jgi:hypothetical protein
MKLPVLGKWRRKATTVVVVMALLPVLPAIAFTLAVVIGHVLSAVWLWAVGVIAVVVAWRLVMRRF